MLRPELREFAKAQDHVMIVGRVAEVRRHGEHTDVMLKNCTVRKVERRVPIGTHPEVRTDHLWLRMPTAAMQAEDAPADCPAGLRHLYRRNGIQMLRLVRVVGRAGFYTQSDGSLGIGVPAIEPVIPQQRMWSMVMAAWDCFETHPWRKECADTFKAVAAKVRRALREEWILLDQSPEEAERVLGRMVQRVEANQRAEAKARRGTERVTPSLPGLNPRLDDVVRGRSCSAVDALMHQARVDDLRRHRFGRLPS